MSDRTLVVTDDLTGGIDTGHGFAVRGYETVVRINPDFDVEDANVLVVNTDSRYLSANEAATRVRDTLTGLDASVVYKKVDSTLRGNLGAEIEAVMETMERNTAVVAPAFPSNGRTTACGYQLVNGKLVIDTEVGNDPDATVTKARLPEYLRNQGASDVIHAGIERVAGNDIETALASGKVITFDVVHERHLEAIAETVDGHADEILLVGSGGLAEHTRIPGKPKADQTTQRETPMGSAFGVVGSTNSQTLSQIDGLPDSWIVDLDGAKAVTDSESAAVDAANACTKLLAKESSVILTSARGRGDVEAVLSAAADAGVDDHIARKRVSSTLATASRMVWEEMSPDGIFLTGGAIAYDVLDALKADAVTLL